ncbi:unnamed protein product [Blepharisma stoltei]|uniref:Uncharacterized protein n=1 Tax=Blepharisma stoltei TaxID=1481888 RepID=A0AAU9K6G1_9CILI|nr:unnamed protein product [Blepharisma stoltei]
MISKGFIFFLKICKKNASKKVKNRQKASKMGQMFAKVLPSVSEQNDWEIPIFWVKSPSASEQIIFLIYKW